MATIDIKRPHSLDKEVAKTRAEDLAKKMQEKFGLAYKWEGDKIKFDAPSGLAKGTTGTIEISSSEVKVAIDLPFLLRAMKGKIEDKINENLTKITG